METGRLDRLVPLAGAAFAILFAVAFLASGSSPGTKASGEEVIAHYKDSGKILTALLVLLVGAVLFVFFIGYLRNAFGASGRGSDWLATVVFGGGLVYAVGLTIFAMSQIALIDAADLGQPQVAQALNIIDNDNFFPTVLGLVVILLATGWLSLRVGILPRWLAWVSIVLGVVALAGPLGFVAFLLFPIWVLVVSVLLYRRPVLATQP